MAIEVLTYMFLKAQLAASGAILLALVLRLPVRRVFGAEIGYHLWLLVPVAALASLFPTVPEFGAELHGAPDGFGESFSALRAPVLEHAPLLAVIWAAGVLALGALFALGQWRFDRSARAGKPPLIVSPKSNVIYSIRSTDGENRGLALRAETEADVRKIYWFSGTTFLGSATAGEPLNWQPQSGTYNIVALDDYGRSNSCTVTIQSSDVN